MKYLTLLRHAKSSWDDPALPDHDRPLNHRGQHDAPRVGKALAQLYTQHDIAPPGLALVSTAARARQTADLVLPHLGTPPIHHTRDLYLASPDEMLAAIAQADEETGHLILVAHNPGTHHLANLLCPGTPIDTYPTCCATLLQLDITHWPLADTKPGQRLATIRPKELP